MKILCFVAGGWCGVCTVVASTKFLHCVSPVQERLRDLPVEIIEAAKLVKELGLSRHGLDVVHKYVSFHVQLALSKLSAEMDVHFSKEVVAQTMPKLPSLKKVLRQIRTACDREQDGDARVAKFVVPDSYKNAGLYENEKEFKWTCIVSTLVEVLQDRAVCNNETINFRSTFCDDSMSSDTVYDEFSSGKHMKTADVLSGAYPNYDFELLYISLYADAASPAFAAMLLCVQ